MELDFDKYCILDGSPTTVLPAPRAHSKVPNRKSNRKSKCGNEMLSLNEDFTKIKFNRYLSASCKDVPSRRSNREDLKRGSIYQSSKEVTFLKRSDDAFTGRKKIEFSRGSESTLSFGIIDSLCSSDEDTSLVERNRSSVMSLSEQSTSSFCKNQVNYPLDPIHGRIVSKDTSSSDRNKKAPRKEPSINLHKSLSAKLAMPHSPLHSESEGSKASSPKARFDPVKKMFDPFVKSKSHRSSLSCAKQLKETRPEAIKEPICKLHNLSNKPHHVCEKKEDLISIPLSSPAHLHGILKLDNKNGVPFFEFSIKSPEDLYIAKTWKADNCLNWVYTFHSLHHRRKSNANKELSSMVGQMKVSCYLCTELKNAGSFNDSMVTEFVIYDVAHSRKSISSQDNSSSSPDGGLIESPPRSQPLKAAELNPELEIAAIVMQVPFEKRESLKFKMGERKTDEPLPNLLELCRLEGISENSDVEKMHVVIPAGNHSSPSDESRGPSPLLDRWRLGGGCDCGGWDMACPIDVFANANFHVDNNSHAELFVQGSKHDMPAFSMRMIEDGKYSVDFHAKLSSLQAFSICVAILHAAEASTAVGQERSKQMLQSDSLRVFAEEGIKNLIDAIAEEEKFKGNKKIEEVLPSFVVNPPFSPIARV